MSANDPLTVLRHALDLAEERVREAEDEAAKLRQAIAILSGGSPTRGSYTTERASLGAGEPRETTEQAAIRILRTEGRPMHIKEIAQEMKESGLRDGDLARIRMNIRKPIERSKTIRKLGGATYALDE